MKEIIDGMKLEIRGYRDIIDGKDKIIQGFHEELRKMLKKLDDLGLQVEALKMEMNYQADHEKAEDVKNDSKK